MTITLVHAGRVLVGFCPDDEPVIHEDACLLVRDGEIVSLGALDGLRQEHPDAPVIGGPDFVVIPGLVNAHHHVGLTPFQLGSPDHPLELWFASRLGLREVDLYLDTLYSAFEMVASGVTTVQHLHSRAPGGASQVLGAAEEVIRAYADIGMRASYSIALRDQNRLVYEADQDFLARLPGHLRSAMAAYFQRFTLPLEDQIRVFEQLHCSYREHPRVRIQVAPSNLHWLTDRALEAAAEMSERADVPMHMHLLETPYQRAYAHRRTGGSALAHIHRLGLTGPKLTLGHGVWMTQADIELCASTGTRICHNCSSNFRLKSGVAPVNRFLARKIPVAIGIDEAGINDDRDMLQEMRLVLNVHREPGIHAPQPSPAAVLRMATEHGAATTPFGERIGRLSPGSAADLVLFDWKAVTCPYQNDDIPLVDVLLQRAKTSAVKTVMVAGEVIYRDGRFTKVDRNVVLDEIAKRMRRPPTRAEIERRELSRAVFPYVRRVYDGYLAELRGEPHERTGGRF